jgi:hypothetical protein
MMFDNNSSALWESEDYNMFKPFCCSAVISFYRNKKRFIDHRRSATNMERASMNRKRDKDFYSIPIQYIATCIGVSKTTANSYIKIAIESGMIEVKKDIKTLKTETGKPITLEHYSSLKISYKGYVFNGRLRRGKKYVKLICANRIKSNLHLKHKRYS